LAESAVKIVKDGLSKMEKGSLETRLYRFLFTYRVTPHSTTGISPAEMLMGRALKTRLHLVKPDIRGKVASEQLRQQKYTGHHKFRQFNPGDTVFALWYAKNTKKWLPATIVRDTGPLSYIVVFEDGQETNRHIDQLRARAVLPFNSMLPVIPEDIIPAMDKQTIIPDKDKDIQSKPDEEDVLTNNTDLDESNTSPENAQLRRSSRVIKPPDRLIYHDDI
jgi:hypothetical protein